MKVKTLENKAKVFEEKEEELRQAATERGRRKVPIIVRQSMAKEFTKLKYNPYDIKAILHPVDFVVFDGLNKKDTLNEIVFLSRSIDNDHLNTIRRSVKRTIDNGVYTWQVARANINGKIEFDVK